MNKRELELYIHIPFCARKCSYCDFLSFAAPERVYREYMDKLIEEICGQGPNFQEYRVSTIFVGGGTPSILPADLIMELFATLSENFDIALDAEVTLEANPGTLTMEKLEVYRQSGINRLSIGLQSADDKELKYLGRIHSYDSFLKSYQRARQAGFKNINVDLMSALPGQDVHSWKTTLKKVMMLKPEHISAYSLIIEEGTPFFERFGEPECKKGLLSGGQQENSKKPETASEVAARAAVMTLPDLPDEDTDREMYHLTKEMMAAQGYERYEISNYAKKGYECRHNTGYWTGVEYLGLGLGASSYTYGYRYHNTEDLQEYLSLNLYEGGAAARDIEELSLEDKMEEFMFVGLRMMKGVSGSEFLERFGLNMWNVYGDVLKKLEQQGLIEVEAPMVRLTERGIDVSNVVLSEFLIDRE
ncbi:coproporphyrinogen-III oxidase family protein [Clostridium sp. AM42-4]|uniref:coproporphyrinogen-III oxidase family protein n=1 Tax=Clostridium sp. AM42-4 TaxID=2292305 RepID=UPI000E46AD56|nr:coproporphyrinogen-III oxidase family protein [Clostridium sp. AM42-4]RHS88899.1 radical SAM protein [Clostridium sp. AM42-4]